MILAGAAALLLLVFGGQERPRPPGSEGTVTVRHQQIIIRVTGGSRGAAPAAAPLIQWRESRGPRCIAAAQILGATRVRQNSFDLVLRDRRRLRARLDRRCPALDYYYGFYVNMTEDGRICSDRDAIRSRAGGECRIEDFRSLTAATP